MTRRCVIRNPGAPPPPRRRAAAGLGALALLAAAAVSVADLPAGARWPAWRGDGSGCSEAAGLPLTWNASNHVAWRTPLPGEGSSSPVVWDRRVFVTASTDRGTNRWVLCLDARDGRILWQRRLDAQRSPRTDPKAGYAAATPATDGRRLYVFFDSPGLAAFDLDGTPLWTLPLGPFNSPYNMSSSPVVSGDRVLQCCDHAGDAFILAADAASGRVVWKTPRTLSYHYGSPLVFDHGGIRQVAVAASTVKSYDVATGAELWSCAGLAPCVAPSPIYAGGLLYATSGRNGPTLGIDPGGTGTVTETRLRLQLPSGGPYVPSPLHVGGRLLLPGDDGVIRAVDTLGRSPIVARLRAHFTASPVRAGRRLYWPAESGDTFVLDADGLNGDPAGLPVLAVNPLGELILASPAVAGGCLFLRTAKALYAVSGDTAPSPAAAAPSAAPADLAKLRRRFQAHPAPEGDDVPVRLAVVDALGRLGGADAAAFLKEAAVKDPQWDVCEAAAKALAEMDHPAATAALLDLAGDSRPYVKVIAAGGLGRTKSAAAVPVLLKGLTDRNPLVRVARLAALAEIGSAAAAVDPAPILEALRTALADPEVTVRLGAVRGLAVLAGRPDADRASMAAALRTRLADPSPAVTAAVRTALCGADPGKAVP